MAAKKQTTKRTTQRSSSADKSRGAKRSTSARAPAKAKQVNEKKKMTAQTKAIWLAAVSVLLFFLTFIEGENIWYFVHTFLKGMFGYFTVLWPILLLYIAIITALEKRTHRKVSGSLALAILAIFVASGCVYVYQVDFLPQKNYFEELADLYVLGTQSEGAGLLSGILGIPAAWACGLTGAMVVMTLVLVVNVMFLFGITIYDIYKMVKRPVDAVKDNVALAREQQAKRREEREAQRKIRQQQADIAAEQEKQAVNQRPKELNSTAAYEFSSFEKKPENKYNDGFEDFSGDIDIPFGEERSGKKAAFSQESPKDKMIKLMHTLNSKEDEYEEDKPAASQMAEFITKKKNKRMKGDHDQMHDDPQAVPLHVDQVRKAESKSKKQNDNKEQIAKEIEIHNQSEEKEEREQGYVFPPMELLHPAVKKDDVHAMKELHENGERLIRTLASFGVKAQITDISRGPSVTRFELQPAPGVKISKITNLADDIALNLAANGVRIEAPIPGKAAVGIEVPNKIVTMVSMRELIDSREFKTSKSNLSVVLGKDISGNIVVTDLGKMPHLLIAGTTGSGKSVCVNSILLSLIYKSAPEDVKMLLIDPKMVEFSKYKGIPHLLIPVVSDAKKAAGALGWAVNEMLNRYKTFAAYNVRDVESYNKMIDRYNAIRITKTPEQLEANPLVNEDNLPIPEEHLPRIVIAIDELADLMMAAPGEVEDAICRLAQMARAAGMHLVIATQRPSVNVITGVIKANIPSRISLKVSSQIDSRTILDIGGAEKLIGRGDMLFSPVGAPKPLRVQGCYASDEEIENVTGYIKRQHKSEYNEEVAEEIDKITAQELNKNDKSLQGGDESKDEMLDEAIKVVVEAGQASTSLLQRKLRLGYARAGRLVDEMEQMGIVGPHEGSKARAVLITYQQWLERNNLTGE